MRSEHKPNKILETYLTRLEENAENFHQVSFNTLKLTVADVTRLAKAIKKNTHLEILNLTDCNLQSKHIPIIADAIKYNSSIISIHIEEFKDDSNKTKLYLQQIQEKVKKNNEIKNNDNPSFKR